MKSITFKMAAVTLLGGMTMVGVISRAEGPAKEPQPTSRPAEGPDEAGPTKFYGAITAVDAKAMTFTIGEQTFSVIGETHMTKDDQPATIADATVGEVARGTYTKASDGKLNVTKVRFGKKGGGKTKEKGGEKAGEKEPATQPAN